MMEILVNWYHATARFLPLLVTLTVAAAIIGFLNWDLRRRWRDKPQAQFRFQLIMLSVTLAAVLAVVIALPIQDKELRLELLSLIGILLSAAIALSSTTFIGNIMAGIMLKAVRSARPGDFVTIGDLTGRVTEMDLLHTQVQTEFRDLVTVPNLYMVTQPVHVVRASGTIINAEVSLGYDVHHERVSKVLLAAAETAGLKDGFVHVRVLGDFAVTYRVGGLLEDVQSLISGRAQLRTAVLDSLHAAGIEIVSPNFMNTRAIGDQRRFIPASKQAEVPQTDPEKSLESIAFDIADEAASLEELRKAIEAIDARLSAKDEEITETLRSSLEARKVQLLNQVEVAEKRRAEKEDRG
jgi:small conductance mechanosensitive channel